MPNQYGLDADYFKKKLKLIVRDAEMYTPDEMFAELTRLAGVAIRDREAMLKAEIEKQVQSILDNHD